MKQNIGKTEAGEEKERRERADARVIRLNWN